MGFPPSRRVVPRELTASFAGISVNQPVPEWTTLITSQFCMAVLLRICCFFVFLATTLKTAWCKILIFLSHVWRFGSFNAVVLFPKFWVPSLGASGAIAGVMGAYILASHALKFSP